MDPQEIAQSSHPDGQVNVWGGRLSIAERLFGRGAALLLDCFGARVGLQIIWLKHPERIGEIALHAGIESAALRSGLRPRRVRYCIQRDYPVANFFWDECIRRMLPVRDWLWPIVQSTEDRIAEGRRTRPQWLQAAHAIHKSRDRSGLMESAGPPPGLFSQEEMDAGLDWLRSVGWREGEKFVCLLVRDFEYLRSFGGGPGSQAEREERNSYRDSDIRTYRSAAEWLADQGVWVLRMGKKMAVPFGSKHPKVLDFAFCEERSDFLDVWLFANCDLCISVETGIDKVSDVFRRPMLLVNYLPAAFLLSWSMTLAAPKPAVWKNTGRRLSLEELIAANWQQSSHYIDNGIEVRDMNAGQIRDVVREAWCRLTGDWVEESSDERRSRAAWKALQAHEAYPNWHGYRHPRANFSSVWLQQLEGELASENQLEHE